MFGGIFFASGPFAGGLVKVTAAAINLAANVTISLTASAALPPTHFTAAATITITARGDLVVPIITTPGIAIDGVPVTGRVRLAGVTIRDILNDAPNTCTFTIEGTAPAIGQSVRVVMGNRLLFAGAVQTVDASYESKPTQLAWHVTAIDDTAAANARRPFGTWIGASATEIAQSLTATFAPGFSAAGIALGLPPVTIVFDGADTFIACLARLATAVGGYCKVDDHTVYLFISDTANPPQPIDETHRFLASPPITSDTDSSQLRTRVYGRGYGERIPADVAPGESLVPIQDGTQFPPLGGLAILATTADGAQSEKVAYTSVELKGGGTLVGPGAGPTIAPVLGIAPGAGVTNGHHDVSVVFITAAGKSLAGPAAAIDVPVFPPPTTAPAAGAATSGTGPDQGSHDYAASFVTSFGETLPSPISNAVSTSATVGELAPPGTTVAALPSAGGSLDDGYHEYVTTLVNANGETTPGGQSVAYQVAAPNRSINLTLVPTGPAGTTARKIYRRSGIGGVGTFKFNATIPDNTTTTYLDTKPNSALGADAPTANTTGTAVQRIPVSSIPIGPAGVTARNLYRRFNGAGSFRLVTTIANNTGTTFTDAVANSALGAAALSTPTAVGNQIVATIPRGASAVTARELYMSPVGSSVRKLALVVNDNLTTSVTITIADAALAAQPVEPIADTSGLQQPNGQVNPGSTVLPVAAAATFRAGGGWVILAGGQVVRYSAISGQTLTGIPPTGAGAITTTVLYGQQAIPSPMLVGVTGIVKATLKGSAVSIWVQRDDLLAQAEHAARTGGDGIVEFLIVDTGRGLEALTARCDADLKLFARPIVTVAYATRDLNTKSGKTVDIDLASPAIVATLTIQEVTITEIGIAPGLPPRYSVKASSVRFSLEDTLRRLVAGGPIVGGSS